MILKLFLNSGPICFHRYLENMLQFAKELRQLSITEDRLKQQAVHFLCKSNILLEAYRQASGKVNKLNIELYRELFTQKLTRKMVILRVCGKVEIRFLIRSQKPHRLLHLKLMRA